MTITEQLAEALRRLIRERDELKEQLENAWKREDALGGNVIAMSLENENLKRERDEARTALAAYEAGKASPK